MRDLLDRYLNHLLIEKGAAGNTLEAYGRDLNRYASFLEQRGIDNPRFVVPETVVEFLVQIKGEGLSANSMNRALAALRGYYKFLLQEKVVDQSPLANIELAKVWMRLPDTVSKEEMNLILSQPGEETPKAQRDSAMLELLYATGLRVSELAGLTMNSINWQVGFLAVMGKRAARKGSFPSARPPTIVSALCGRSPSETGKIKNDRRLVPEPFQGAFTRQGLWKNIIHYVRKAGLQKNVHPHTFRHSFASHLLEGG